MTKKNLFKKKLGNRWESFKKSIDKLQENAKFLAETQALECKTKAEIDVIIQNLNDQTDLFSLKIDELNDEIFESLSEIKSDL